MSDDVQNDNKPDGKVGITLIDSNGNDITDGFYLNIKEVKRGVSHDIGEYELVAEKDVTTVPTWNGTIIYSSDPKLTEQLCRALHKQGQDLLVGYIGRSIDTPSTKLNAAIETILSDSFNRSIGPSVEGMVNDWYKSLFMTDFHHSDLHYRLSDEATKLKDQRQQQSRKAQFMLREKKRVQRGRSHAKQKHKGMSRFM